jgi:hypothetical protein
MEETALDINLLATKLSAPEPEIKHYETKPSEEKTWTLRV